MNTLLRLIVYLAYAAAGWVLALPVLFVLSFGCHEGCDGAESQLLWILPLAIVGGAVAIGCALVKRSTIARDHPPGGLGRATMLQLVAGPVVIFGGVVALVATASFATALRLVFVGLVVTAWVFVAKS